MGQEKMVFGEDGLLLIKPRMQIEGPKPLARRLCALSTQEAKGIPRPAQDGLCRGSKPASAYFRGCAVQRPTYRTGPNYRCMAG
ncbi:hypothetical protein MCOR02_008112 [Pyricularia oryzae]|uniref:Uncharacterized protein n=3 Tax=Pyricularia oryzae TaxID=318829 RepID=A0A4P7NHP0_PYROR|nr:hypothetical protein OOU_Y34scaffold00559g7 [Pyricularia oryzae Y34]KAH8843312.1 hypothetical protein MCOR01_004132 [Pyricularia oryzae]KAH9430783.1 hypothetical protein MCOR02_008112 [Pyricularia oryzae]KAI6339397.1 hypothetical protein MCOR30_002790 [Pyricularia oryzae]KAI6355509.1 hypothetical protein MCOR31_011170 [Pyricularia oryzae]